MNNSLNNSNKSAPNPDQRAAADYAVFEARWT
jgi:hypothetical protein